MDRVIEALRRLFCPTMQELEETTGLGSKQIRSMIERARTKGALIDTVCLRGGYFYDMESPPPDGML